MDIKDTLAQNMPAAAKNLIDKPTNIVENIKDKIPTEMPTSLSGIKKTLTDASDDKTGMFSSFSSGTMNDGSKEFLQSNSLVAKFAFFIFVLIVFGLLFRLFLMVMTYFMGPKKSPIIIDGMIDAKKQYIIETDPNVHGSIPIYKSVNEYGGAEFTWSTWLHVEDTRGADESLKHRHIFHKGSFNINDDGINEPLNCPGLYLKPNTNTLLLIMNSYDNIKEEIEIKEIPLNKWINVIIVCKNKQVDVYINGTLIRRHVMTSVPKQNYEKIYIALNGGFPGYISSLRYFDSVLSAYKIDQIVDQGPNLNMIGGAMEKTKPPYISTRWFFMENEKYDL